MKFKAYSHRYKFMLDVTNINFSKELDGCVTFDGNEGDVWDATFDDKDYTILQFTGLFYNNGEECYEGDIFKDSKGQLGRVYKVTGGFMASNPAFKSSFSRYNPSMPHQLFDKTDFLVLYSMSDPQFISWFEADVVKVGDVFNNIDLLK